MEKSAEKKIPAMITFHFHVLFYTFVEIYIYVQINFISINMLITHITGM
jgi:hypothetical protein